MGGMTVRRALGALILAGIVAACGGDDDAGGHAGDTTTTTADAGPEATGTTLGGNAGVQRSDAAQSYVDAITDASSTGAAVSQSEDQNRCFAEAYVDTVGADALAAAVSPEDVRGNPGFNPDELGIVMTPEQQDAFYAGLKRCIDTKGFFVGVVAQGSNWTPDQTACVAGHLDDTALERILVAGFDGDTAPVESDQDFTAIIDGLIGACPDAMAAAGYG
ncbi:MAG TPA: hypothetical protein VH479_25205 [Acidimicrobiales bacterium]